MDTTAYVKKAFWKFLITGVLTSAGIAVGTFVDAIIVGNAVGAEGLAVINLSFPIYMLYNMISFIAGTGGMLLISQAKGRDDTALANSRFTLMILIGLAVSVSLTVCGIIFKDNIIRFLGADDAVFSLASDYIAPLLAAPSAFIMPPLIMFSVRSDANPTLAAVGISTFVVVNLVLDLVFIYAFDMGISGAIFAIILAEASAFFIYCSHFLRRSSSLKLNFSGLKPQNVFSIMKLGFGTGLGFLSTAVIMILFNNLLMTGYDISQVAIYGVIINVGMFSSAVFDGVSIGIATPISTYHGESDSKSIRLTFKMALLFTLIAGAAVSLIIFLFSEPVTHMFGISDKSVLILSDECLKLFAASIVFACINVLLIAYLQSIDKPETATAIAILRGFVFIIPTGTFLIGNFGAKGIALSHLTSEVLTIAAAVLLIVFIKRRQGLDNFYLLPKEKSLDKSSFYEAFIDDSLAGFDEISSQIEDFCENAGLDFAKSYLVNLAVEELVLNVVKLGFKKKGCYLQVKIVLDGGKVTIRTRDNAKGYNPFDIAEKKSDDDMNLDVLGIQIIKKKAKSFDYQRKLVFNNCKVEI